MNIAIKRTMIILMVIMMLLAFTPFVGGADAVYAGDGISYNVPWVYDAILHTWNVIGNEYFTPYDYVAVAGTPLIMDYDRVSKELGYESYPSVMEQCYTIWSYKTSEEGKWERFDVTYFDGETHAVIVPQEAKNGGYIRACVVDDPDGWYYYSEEIPVVPYDWHLVQDSGSLGVDLVNPSSMGVDDITKDKLISTFLIANYQETIRLKVTEQKKYEVDADKDGKFDIVLEKKVVEKPFKWSITALTNRVDYGKNDVGVLMDMDGELVNELLGKRGVYYNSAYFILPKKDISKAKFTLSASSLIYNGKSQSPTVTVKDKGKKLVKGTSYTVSGSRTKVGKGTLTIKGKGKYKGTKKLTFKIVPKGTSISSISPLYKGFKVVWKKQATETSGYQVRYANNADFKNSNTKTVSGSSVTSRSVTKLASKKYWVKVRTYKSVNGEKFYSKWSDVKTVSPRQ